MKTKISHLGRSTVSVVLAVMMLLSTMLIGTISVNAADYFTVGDTFIWIFQMQIMMLLRIMLGFT